MLRLNGLFLRHGFEEGVAERPIGLRRPVEILDALLPGRLVDEALGERSLADTFDHGREGVFRKSLDQSGRTGIHVDDSRRYLDVPEAGAREERIQRAPDQRVATRTRLQVDETLYRLSRVRTVGMEVRGAVISFDDGDRQA